VKFFNTATRIALLTAFVAASGAALTASAVAADTTPAPAAKAAHADMKQDMEKRRQEFFKHMSDRLAERLEIKASQQGAFQAYTTALQTAFTPPAHHPDIKSDAAGIARMNADMAAEHAKRLATIADATAKFQEVLTPDQRKTFDQMAAAFMHHRHGMHHGFGERGHGWGRDGGHQGDQHGDHHGWGQDGGDHQHDGAEHN